MFLLNKRGRVIVVSEPKGKRLVASGSHVKAPDDLEVGYYKELDASLPKPVTKRPPSKKRTSKRSK